MKEPANKSNEESVAKAPQSPKVGQIAHPEILVCFAVREEAKFFLNRKPRLSRALITGMGQANATAALEQRLSEIPVPKLVLTCGFAGGLNPVFKNDQILFQTDEDEFKLREALERCGATKANFYCTTRVAITSQEKRNLWHATGLDAVEMESESLREICRDRGIPSATVRAISDSAMEDLPLDFNTLMTPTQRINYAKLGWALVRAPMKLAELLAFQQKTQSASKALADFLRRFLTANGNEDFSSILKPKEARPPH
jgi:nucleoside phosphorylase